MVTSLCWTGHNLSVLYEIHNLYVRLVRAITTLHCSCDGRRLPGIGLLARRVGMKSSAIAVAIGTIGLAAAVLAPPEAARAASLSVVTVAAPAVNCVFNASCTVTVSDTLGHLANTPYGANALLQSRTYSGPPGPPGA